MSLTLHFHPLSSYCHKVLIALYENGTDFTPHIVDLGNADAAAALAALWPIRKFPVLQDTAKDRVVPESSIIIEYLAQHHPGRTVLIPQDAGQALQTRLQDRFCDLYVMEPTAKVFTDRLRPAGQNDSYGVEKAKELLHTACAMLDRRLAANTWMMGGAFTMADCAATPALFYADKALPLAPQFPNVAAYLHRLTQRPSVARVLEEAQPYLAMLPQ